MRRVYKEVRERIDRGLTRSRVNRVRSEVSRLFPEYLKDGPQRIKREAQEVIRSRVFTYEEFLFPYVMLLRLAEFISAYEFRREMECIFLQEPDNPRILSGISDVRRIGLLLELGMNPHEFLKNYHFRNVGLASQQLIELIFDVFSPSKDPLAAPPLRETGIFRELICDRSIAVVGPRAPGSVNYGDEIDSHDVVVRFNHSSSRHAKHPRELGERTDVAYFNGRQSERYLSSNNSEDKRVFYVTKNYLGRGSRIRYRRFPRFSRFSLYGEYNALPNALIDLLIFKPRAIKVFNVDLQLTDSRIGGYRESLGFPSRNLSSPTVVGFARSHDPILQFRAVNAATKSSPVTADLELREILSQGLQNYLSALEMTVCKSI